MPTAAGRPRPALKESPSTTILIGLSSASVAGERGLGESRSARHQADHQHEYVHKPARSRLSTNPAEVPYDRTMDSLIEPSSLAGLSPDTISISNVNLSLGTGAARVHILKDISLRVDPGRSDRPDRAFGLRQIHAADGDGGAGTT